MRPAVVVAAAILIASAYMIYRGQLDENGEGDNAPDIEDYAYQAQDYIEGFTEQGDEMNKTAFLRALRLGEGTSGPAGYTALCGGGNFTDWSDHPANLGWSGWRLPEQMAINAGFPSGVAYSTAAGAYQFIRPTWNRLAAKLGLSDFTPASQDAAAWCVIGEKGAQVDVLAGRIESAVAKLGKVWASLPGAAAKQRQVTIAAFINEFQNNGGTLA